MGKYILMLLCLLNFSVNAECFNVINETELVDISDAETELDPETLEGLETNNYIVPNERNPNFYINFIKDRKGALLSVGTFRALIIFSSGKFDRLIMIDVAKPILDFNRNHLSSILELSSQGSWADQRKQYVQKYQTYLEAFEQKSGFKYYWQSDKKWEKIVRSLRENKIHVVRGNFASVNANKTLLHALKTADTAITLDHSNLLQYVTKTKYAHAIEAFSNVAHHHDLAVLATARNDLRNHRLWPFLIGSDPSLARDNEKLIQWYYYYYPAGRAYLHAIDPDYYDGARLGKIELEDWQTDLVATQVYTLLLENPLKDEAWLRCEIDLFLSGRTSHAGLKNSGEGHLKWAPAAEFGDASIAPIWSKVLAKTKEGFLNLLPLTVYSQASSLEGTLDDKALTMEFFKVNREQKMGPLQAFMQASCERNQLFIQKQKDAIDSKVKKMQSTAK